MVMQRLGFVATALLLAGAAFGQKLAVKDVVAGMEATWNKTDAYACRMDVWTRRGSEEKVQAFRFSFQKPHLIRLKVLADPHRGADVVYRDGKIRAAERILGIRVKKGMSRKEPDFYSLRGVPFWEADLGSQIEHIRALLPAADATGAATAERARTGGEAEVFLTLRWRGEDPQVRQGVHTYATTYRLDGHTYFPLERTTLEDGVKVEDVRASEIDLHPAFSEGTFRL